MPCARMPKPEPKAGGFGEGDRVSALFKDQRAFLLVLFVLFVLLLLSLLLVVVLL